MDLSSQLESASDAEFFRSVAQPSHGMTQAELRGFLDSHGIQHRATQTHKRDRDDGLQYDLEVCPLCNHKEGNPAVWLSNGAPCFKCFWAGPGCDDVPKKTFADLKAHYHRPGLVCINALDLPRRFPNERKQVIPGLLRVGDVANIVGGPKTRKSFFAMQLLISVASGTPFLGWPTNRGRVRLFDNELRADDLTRRMTAMVRESGLNWEDVAANIDISPLRGTLADLATIRDELCRVPPDTYSLVIVDALYKALPSGIDENSNSDMTAAYVMLDESAERHNAAVACIHHTSKGNQASKSVSDMGSGAGAQSRSADVHIVLREHEDENTIVLQAIIRSQKPIEPVCLTFDYPLWRLAPDKNPANVATAIKKAVPTLDAFLRTIPLEAAPKTEALEWSKNTLCASKTAVQSLLREAINRGLVEVEKPKNLKLPHTIRKLP
jgi:hypothetical protein